MAHRDKEWKICVFCKYNEVCSAGASRIINLPPNSPIINEIGCFDHETYKNQKAYQMKLFGS